jgi:L-alanine-DL-glutamate epimerase-like enolase superfamily enzyme
MKISSVEVLPVDVPIDFPYGEVRSVAVAVARLRTDDGLEGIGHAMPLYGRNFRSMVAAIQELGQLLIGEDACQPERTHKKIAPSLPGGTETTAAAALDIAVWDLTGKAAGLPLYKLAGGHRNRVAAYASLRLGRDKKAEELPGIAASLVEQGFRAMKTNLGPDPSVAVAVNRIRAVREAIGRDVRLLVDVNFNWNPKQAIRVGQALEEFELFWIEDPVPTANLQGLAEVKEALRTPIMAGEALYGLTPFRALFEARAVDLVMPDIMRVGGITPFLKIAHMAEAFGLPLANHLMPEISANLVAAVPHGTIVEYVPFATKLFPTCPPLDNGDLVLSDKPGHGLELDEDFARAHRLDL